MIRFPQSPEEFASIRLRCQFGITEGIGALAGGLFGGDALAGLGSFLGIGSADAAAGTGAAALGAEAGSAAGALGAGDLGALGTAGAFIDPAAAAGLGTTGLGSLGTAADFLGAGAATGGVADALGVGAGASGADAAATQAIQTGLASGTGSLASTPSTAQALSELVSGAVAPTSPIAGPSVNSTSSSVFNTGAAPISNVSAGPAGPAASGAVAPVGNAGAFGASSDLTSGLGAGAAPGSTVPGATSVGGAAGPSPLTTGGTSGGNWLDNIVNGATNQLQKNALPAAIGAGGLLYNVIKNNQPVAGVSQNTALANQQAAQGQQLESYLQSGTLPAGLQQSVSTATQSAKQAAISNAAAQGLSTDPTKNTALATQLASIDQQATITTSQIGQQLLSTGVSETGLASNVYTQLAGIDQTEQQQISAAIASFAKGLAGGGLSVKLA